MDIGDLEHDHSDFRFHVGFHAQRCYAFDTAKMKQWLKTQCFSTVVISLRGMRSGEGILVPVAAIPFLKVFNFRTSQDTLQAIKTRLGDSQRAQEAVRVVTDFYQSKGYGVWTVPASQKFLQLAGLDLLIGSKEGLLYTVQVKCDLLAGDKALGGSGNLYVETWSRNFDKIYE